MLAAKPDMKLRRRTTADSPQLVARTFCASASITGSNSAYSMSTLSRWRAQPKMTASFMRVELYTRCENPVQCSANAMVSSRFACISV